MSTMFWRLSVKNTMSLEAVNRWRNFFSDLDSSPVRSSTFSSRLRFSSFNSRAAWASRVFDCLSLAASCSMAS